jgi:hypothetical protein
MKIEYDIKTQEQLDDITAYIRHLLTEYPDMDELEFSKNVLDYADQVGVRLKKDLVN